MSEHVKLSPTKTVSNPNTNWMEMVFGLNCQKVILHSLLKNLKSIIRNSC